MNGSNGYQAGITAIEYHLPEKVLTNDQLAADHPDWSVGRIAEKTGIRERHIAGSGEYCSDLAYEAAQKLFRSGAARPPEIDAVLLCTQSPDYLLPTTACMLQHRLNIPTSAGALDINLGCSGYVYGLALAKGLIESEQARTVLLLTSDTYTKFLDPDDRSVRALFGDAAAATLIQAVPADSDAPPIERVVWGTDGEGAPNIILRSMSVKSDCESGSKYLYMNGPEIFNFTVKRIPCLVQSVLSQSSRTLADVDLFVFHQANRYLLDHLRRKIGIPPQKFIVSLEDCGNTVSSTIPIALKRASLQGVLKPRDSVLLAGFGVGYSWAGTIIRWPATEASAEG